MLVDPFNACFSLLFLHFPFFFLLVMEKEKKACFHAETNDLEQQKACRAPICWSKYTTQLLRTNELFHKKHSYPFRLDLFLLTLLLKVVVQTFQ